MDENKDTSHTEPKKEEFLDDSGRISLSALFFPPKSPSPVSLPKPVQNGELTRTFIIGTLLTLLLISIGGYLGYTTYFNTNADTTIGKTLRTNKALESGLLAYYTFDGLKVDFASTTGEILDVSGNGYTGDLINADKRTSVRSGKHGQGLSLNGTTTVINTTLKLTTSTAAQPYTLNAWILTRDTLGTVIGQSTGSTNNFLFQVATSGRLYWIKNNTVVASSTASVTNNNWHMLTGVKGGSGVNQTQLYVDGVASGNAGTDSTVFENVNLQIGGATNAPYFEGKIDDVRIYNRALPIKEIVRLYNIGVGSTIGVPATPVFACGTDTVLDADSNVYNTLQIGTQCWMKQNMRVGTRVNIATAQSNNATIEKWCYNDIDSNCTSNNPNYPDGGLYQWNEAMQYSTTAGARGICPLGWHIPTHDEYTTLERAVCTSGTCATDFPYDTITTGFRGTTEGTKLKANGTSGFEANLAGYGFGGFFYSRASNGVFWSSSESGANAWSR